MASAKATTCCASVIPNTSLRMSFCPIIGVAPIRSQVSASVKLDDDHEGAELRFPRQGVDNTDVPVGALLAWPSLVTHPHEVAPLRRGVKHGLTIWFELPFLLE